MKIRTVLGGLKFNNSSGFKVKNKKPGNVFTVACQ